jgi:predicted nucleotidyltransferase
MNRDEVLATLRAHEFELKDLGIARVAVFGSVARGEEAPGSDVDLVVALDEGWGYSLLDEIRLQRHLTELLGVRVDMAVEPLRKPRLRARVEQEQLRAF